MPGDEAQEPQSDPSPGTGEQTLDQAGQNDREPTVHSHDSGPASTHASSRSMTPKERELWAMGFDELFEHAKKEGFGKRGKESRKSGRVYIIKWLLRKEGITPYAVPRDTTSTTPALRTDSTQPPGLRLRTGAVAHPEAILRTSDPALQRQIHEAEAKYRTRALPDLLALAMQRSYQLFKDSAGKMPSRSASALAGWLAAWDVLKSPREKRWWLGDGIDLANKAKALGYDGASTKKYDIIVWLRSTPEDAELEVARVAEPTPNTRPLKRKSGAEAAEAAEAPATTRRSRRPAKGSERPHGWNRGLPSARVRYAPTTSSSRSITERSGIS